MIRYLILILGIALFSIQTYAQRKNNSDTIELRITEIQSSAYPKVVLHFQATRKNGVPVWDLQRKGLRLLENGKPCNIQAFKTNTNLKSISIGMVIDRSQSMEEDPSQLYDKEGKPLFTVDENNTMIVPADYVSPIDNAKSAIKNFASGFNLHKDFISITGFSSSVDKPLPLTNDLNVINSKIDAMQADGKTALYDGMITGLHQVESVNGIKVLVVLTDGHDNMSKSNEDDVINLAVAQGIPVYIIGLGKVNNKILQKIADETRGEYYHAESSSSLEAFYATISKKVQYGYSIDFVSSKQNKNHTRTLTLIDDLATDGYVKSATASFVTSGKILAAKHKVIENEANAEEKPFTIRHAKADMGSSFVGSNSFWNISKLLLTFVMAASIMAFKRRIQSRP